MEEQTAKSETTTMETPINRPPTFTADFGIRQEIIDALRNERETSSQAAKADAGKPIFTLVPPQIMVEIEKIRSYGNMKYHSPDNWKNVEPQRYWEALIRHVIAAWSDYKAVDPESGYLHLSHIACNCAFLLQMIEWEKNSK